MELDLILRTLNDCAVRYLLIGGMNFSLRHHPYTTYDVDIWIEDSDTNIAACENALARLQAEWGATDNEWGSTRNLQPNWLRRQGVFGLFTPHGAVDVFRSVAGLGDWPSSFAKSITEKTFEGTPYQGLSDEDMLLCQLALDAVYQKADRIRVLQSKARQKEGH